MPKVKTLTIKERKFVAAKVAGKTNFEAYKDAGYAPMNGNRQAIEATASKVLNKARIQDAINYALDKHGASPSFAVKNIKELASQTEANASTALAANKLILELHGWKAGERPAVTLNVKSAFFGSSKSPSQPIEGQVVD